MGVDVVEGVGTQLTLLYCLSFLKKAPSPLLGSDEEWEALW